LPQKRSQAFIIFIRNPELGKVKTRIAKEVGDQRALDVYRELLRQTREVALKIDIKRFLFYSESINHNDEWSNEDFNKVVQPKGDLGEKMSQAFQYVLSQYDQVIIIGSDCPKLNYSHIVNAFEQLNHHDVVIGPSLDGGYYLLGFSDYQATLFENINWSTDQVYPQTLMRIENAKLSYTTLEKLSDIDYWADWEKHGW